MGVKHQLILGVVLICSYYVHPGSARESDNSTIRNVTGIVERNINLIEKLPKTDTEQNIVHSDIQENSTNNKRNETLLDDTNEHHDKNAIKEENTIKQEGNEKHRDDNSRSIDIEKYVSPEFQNNVFTLPNFQDTEKFVDDHFDFKPPTEKTSFSDFDLTTPKSVYFDNKYKEAIQKLEQEFEENQNENEHETDDDNDHEQELREHNDEESDEDDEMQVDKLIDEPKTNPNSTLDYKEMKNIIVKNNTEGKMSTSNNVIVEKVKRVNFVSNFSDTKSYDYDSKDNPAETTSPKNILLTTRKTVNLTKPPNNKNNSHILSNKIETETIKAINLVTSEFPVDTEQLSKETILENQIVPTNYTSSTTTENVNSSNNTTVTTETIATTTLSSDLTTTTDNKETITLEDLSTTDKNDVTTTLESTTVELVTMDLVASEKLVTDITEQEPSSTMLNDATVTTITDDAPITEAQKYDETSTDTGTTHSTTFMTTTEDKLSTTTQEPNTEIVQTTVAKEEITTSNNTKLLNPKLLPVIPDNSTITDAVITTTKPDIPTTSTELSEGKDSTRIHPNTTINQIENTQRTVTPPLTEATTHIETTGDELTEIPVGSTETSVGPESPDDGTKGKVVVIVISSIGAICLVLLALLLYVMRKRQNKFNYKQRCRPVSLDDYSVDNLSAYNSIRRKGGDRQSKRSYGNPAFDDPSVPTHPLNFPALAKFASNSDDIKLEFEDIPQITARTSELPEGCEPKNRYANVIPLPETRVYLQAIDGYPNSDYINANYVTGPKNTKGFYIACQAPMQNTVDDFWRMIWEQQTKVILMMTHFFENGVEKCVDYLPPSEVLDCHRLFGDFQVTLKKRDVKEKYIISSLQLKNMVSNSWREVTHFWYLGWPEKGVPTEANSIIAFLIEARSYMKTSTLDRNALANGTNNLPRTEVNPVVVHCSPGTGRTGVLIACDIAIREFEQTRLVDIPKMVYRIRRDRASAVQTKEQYIFIYKVVSLYATKLTGGALESF